MMAVVLTVELLRFSPQSYRATKTEAALENTAKAAGLALQATTTYQGGADLLLLWGPGAPNRFEPMRQQIAAGAHVAALDLAYWHRDRKVRVSIDAAHPPQWVMRHDWPATRWTADRIPTADAWNPDGPVIVAGLGEKARVQYGAEVVDRWEAAMTQAALAAGRTVIHRAKKAPGLLPIDHALRGASCLMTWHSNVAVDAIRMGIPVVCHDGAAAAVCPSTYAPTCRPLDRAVRDRFLANLAWFQWGTTPEETRGCWEFIKTVLA